MSEEEQEKSGEDTGRTEEENVKREDAIMRIAELQ